MGFKIKHKKKGYQQPEHITEVIDSPSDVEIIDAPDELSKPPIASQQLESDASPNVLSSRVRLTNIQELLYMLSNYITTSCRWTVMLNIYSK